LDHQTPLGNHKAKTMRELKGVPHNIENPILGVISSKPPRFFGSHHNIKVIAPDKPEKLRSRAIGFIVGEGAEYQEVKRAIIQVAQEDLSFIHEGDVVLLEPDGKIKFLYERESPHNSLLLTNRCNCKCVMCPQVPCSDMPDLIKTNYALLDLMSPKTEHLGLTGGEPTLLENELVEFIRTCRRKFPHMLLTLLTNGRKLRDLEFSKDIARAGFPNLMIEIPLFADNDGEHDRIMGASGSFYDTIAGLRNLALIRQPVGLRTVLHKLTVGRLTQYAEFVYRNLPFVSQVAFMGMETHGLAAKNLEELWEDPYDYQEQLYAAVKHLVRRNVPVSIYNHQLCILPKGLWQFARRSISTWKVSYLPFCNECKVKTQCCGLFSTGIRHSSFLEKII
jgi:His-Xaa-Ser system radical SAM maturase HxsC